AAAADGSATTQAPSHATDPASQTKPALATLYFGTLVCQRCHAEPSDRVQEPISICRCNELTIWQQQDKHKDAYQALLGPRASRMGKLLDNRTSVSEQKDCLVCHSASLSEQSLADDSFHLEEGVSCAICHGPHEQWVEAHAPPFAKQREAWRRLTGKEKQAQFGLTDLRDPATRAALCTSCHIGNRAEGKVITHEMYAAGHPPLPGIEVAAFSDEMPRHWQYVKEKSRAVQETFKFVPSRFEESQVVLVGGMATFRETMRLLAEQAANDDRKWPQLAQFDCYACHHELESPSWRQHRAANGKPGLPRSPNWPAVLVRLALCHLGQSDQVFNARLKELDEAFDVQPFGKREQISIAALHLVEWTDRPLGALAAATVDDAAARKLLRFLANASQVSALDYDSARQIAWAFRTLAKECFGASNEPWQRATAEAESLSSSLSVRPGRSTLDPLGEALKKRNDFDPKRFREDLSGLSRLLDESLPAPKGP
ncbi:MAG TPA: multiheme c-type cytochrome, partial [Pirellulales bacterium]|nr:multiheme c-type cytochrome [Pirellulales bacterium]